MAPRKKKIQKKSKQKDARGVSGSVKRKQYPKSTILSPLKGGHDTNKFEPFVSLTEERESEIQSVINDEKWKKFEEDHKSKAEIEFIQSKRFIKRVTDIFEELLRLEFNEEQAEEALKYSKITSNSTTDQSIAACLDWLCLHVSASDLPALFSCKELQQTAVAEEAGNIELIKAPLATNCQESSENQEKHPRPEVKAPAPVANQNKDTQDETKVDKSWILARYAEASSSEEEDSWDMFGQNPVAKKEPWEGLEPTDRLKVLKAEFAKGKSQNLKGMNKEEKGAHNTRMGLMRSEISRLEKAGVKVDPEESTKINMEEKNTIEAGDAEEESLALSTSAVTLECTDVVQQTKQEGKGDATTEEEGTLGIGILDEGEDNEFGFGMFEEAEDSDSKSREQKVPSVQTEGDPGEDVPLIPKTCLSKWTGKTPKTHLEELCRKQKLGKVFFSKLTGVGISNGAKCTIKGGKNTAERIFTWECAERYSDAQHGAATVALFELSGKDVPMYRLLPPYFKDLWLKWQEEKDKVKSIAELSILQGNNERIERIVRSIKEARVGKSDDQKLNTHVAPEEEGSSYQDLSDNDCWEDLLDDVAEERPQSKTGCSAAFTQRLRSALIKRQNLSPNASSIEDTRRRLPIFSHKAGILEALHDRNVVVISGDTGCGKTTQVPQFLLEEWASNPSAPKPPMIVCTQPRRIAALSVAERVDEEVGCAEAVGYQIRLQTNRTANTRLIFCTNGILLCLMQDDPSLSTFTHILVDEVHERQADADLLLVSLRRLLNKRKDLKIILMSATLNATLFCEYFGNCPLFTVPGRTFPVEEFYLEDIFEATGYQIQEGPSYSYYSANKRKGSCNMTITGKGGKKYTQTVSWDHQNSDTTLAEDVEEERAFRELMPGYSNETIRSVMRIDELYIYFDLIEMVIVQLVGDNPPRIGCLGAAAEALKDGGAMLLFLPGIGEIRSLYDRLMANPEVSRSGRCLLLPLHSSLSPAEQRRVFKRPLPGVTKIVLSTNIAETSVTIEDITLVLDAGIERQVSHVSGGSTGVDSTSLVKVLCSKASVRQRKGRAGRVRPGVNLRLFSRYTFELSMPDFAKPEMTRIPLEEICLQVVASGFLDCTSFLLESPSPPRHAKVKAALSLLQEDGAIEPCLDESTSDQNVLSDINAYRLNIPGVVVEESSLGTGNSQILWKLTPLGKHLARLPVDVKVGKMLVYAAIFRCLDPILTVAASLTLKSPLVRPMGKESVSDLKHMQFLHPGSDFLSLVNIYSSYIDQLKKGKKAAADFCKSNFLSQSILDEIKDQREHLRGILQKSGLIPHAHICNEGSSITPLVLGIICAGLYPNVLKVVRDGTKNERGCYHRSEKIAIDSSSCNYNVDNQGKGQDWLIFHKKMKTSRVFVSQTSSISPTSLLLFGGNINILYTQRRVTLDEWISLYCPAKVAVLLRELRKVLGYFLNGLVEDPNLLTEDIGSEQCLSLVGIIINIMREEQERQH